METENKNIMPFGKYKGKDISEVPSGYLLYLYDRNKLTGWIKEYAESNINVLRITKNKTNNK